MGILFIQAVLPDDVDVVILLPASCLGIEISTKKLRRCRVDSRRMADNTIYIFCTWTSDSQNGGNMQLQSVAELRPIMPFVRLPA